MGGAAQHSAAAEAQCRCWNCRTAPWLGVTAGRESVSRIHMQPGDTLLLLSDGVSQKDAPKWAKFSSATPPGALASTILKTDAATPDDATVVVVRMERKAKPS